MLTSLTSIKGCCLISLCCINLLPTLALESDKGERVVWSAEGNSSMYVDGAKRILNMKDNVKVTQGSLEISGEEAVFEYSVDSNELIRVTVHGSPVRYQQALDEASSRVVGSSDTILFYRDPMSDEMIVELVGKANIESPDSTMDCAAITYIADRDLIREATGPCEGSLSSASN